MSGPTFTERHYETISKLKLALIVVCLVAIPLTFLINHGEVGDVNHRVTKIESPCLRYGPKSERCKESFEQAVLTITHPEACAILRKARLDIIQCAHARLRQERRRRRERAAAGGGGALQTGSTGHQQLSPQRGGSPDNGGSTNPPVPSPTGHPGHERPPAAPLPSPPASPAPQAPSKPPVSESANGATHAVEAAKGIVCPVNAAGLEVCP